MDIIDRYLTAIGALLPKAEREDIVAELREALTSDIEEKQGALGRPLTRDEEADVLRDFGHPVAVAARYGRQQYLIGPELYPLYILALKIVLAIVAAASVLAGVVVAASGSGEPGPGIVAALAAFWRGAIGTVGALTIVAAILQRQKGPLKFLTDWNPRDLPKAPRRPLFRRQNKFDHAAGVVAQIVFILWWAQAIDIWLPHVVHIPLKLGPSLDLAPAAVWQTLYWPVLGLALAALVSNLLKLIERSRQWYVRWLDLGAQIAAVVIAWIALRAGHWIDVTGPGLPAAALAKVDYGVNVGWQVSLIVAVVCAAGLAAYNAWGLYQAGRHGSEERI